MGLIFLVLIYASIRMDTLLIKPSKANIKSFLEDIREIIRKGVALPTEQLILRLNQKITGWTNYYQK